MEHRRLLAHPEAHHPFAGGNLLGRIGGHATIAALIGDRGLGYPIFLALQEPTPFKTEIYSAGSLVVALALSCDLVLVAARHALVPWTRVHE